MDSIEQPNQEPLKDTSFSSWTNMFFNRNPFTAAAMGPPFSSQADNMHQANENNASQQPDTGNNLLLAKPLEGVTKGLAFVPHVIIVKTGEDILLKILEFREEASCSICILSATGYVSCVRFHDSTGPNGVVTHMGLYEILTMKASFTNCESDDDHVTNNGSVSVSLARYDGRVIGGSVTGMLKAASEVHVVVGSYILENKKNQKNVRRAQNSLEPELAAGAQGLHHSSESPYSHHGSCSRNNDNLGLFRNSTVQPRGHMYNMWPRPNYGPH